MVLSLEDIDQHVDADVGPLSPPKRLAARERFYVEVLAAIATLRSDNGELTLLLALLAPSEPSQKRDASSRAVTAEIH